MRTGSNLLEAMLNAVPGIVCHGELFNPHFIGMKDQTEFLGVSISARDENPLDLLARLGSPDLISGFRFFHDHDPRILEAVIADVRCAKIVLSRNPLESYVSRKIAQTTGQWKITNLQNRKTAKAHFDGAEFHDHLLAVQGFQRRVQHRLQISGQTAFHLDYEDISQPAVINGIAAFVGAGGRLSAPVDTLKKQNPAAITEKVGNPEEMIATLGRMDPFGVSRIPDFEPRRGPATPTLLAAAGAKLLFLPIPGGPTEEVAAWLGGFGDQGLSRNFGQKELRLWKRSHVGHRTFTVIRHPVERAYAVFHSHVLGAKLMDLRAVLQRWQGRALPLPGRFDDQAGADYHAAFLGYLRVVRQGLEGQAGVRVDPHWASQSAVVQGFAQLQTPDHVLRESDLARMLGWLATEVGATAPVFAMQHAYFRESLGSIYDKAIEAAVRDAYQRDYIAFGFGPWR